MSHTLSYTKPATDGDEALPLGNGNLGALCFGDLRTTRIRINDDTAWSGTPHSGQVDLVSAERAALALDEARRALEDDRFGDAERAVQRLQHRHSQAYMPFIDLFITIESMNDAAAPERYHRLLDLSTATHTATGRSDGVEIDQVTRVSAPDGVLVHDVAVSEPVDLSVTMSTPLRLLGGGSDDGTGSILLRMPVDVFPPHTPCDDPIRYIDDPGASLEGAAVFRVEHDGASAEAVDGGLRIRGVRSMAVVLATATTFPREDGVLGRGPLRGDARSAARRARARVDAAVQRGLEAVRADQVADHASLYGRAALELGDPEASGVDTAARLASVNRRSLADDPALIALLFHYGRYLLICSSRPGTLPANLQGIWNGDIRPPWSSNYTLNINLQMNYWAADAASLAETAEPLDDFLERLRLAGAETAARMYAAPGWVVHHNTDAWAYTQMIGHGAHDAKSAFWPMGGIWLARRHIDHAEYGDAREVFSRCYELLSEAAEYAISCLRRLPDGSWGTSPSTSPENDFRTGGSVGAVATSASLDLELIRDHLEAVVRAAALLGRSDEPVAAASARALARLGGPRITAEGTIAEWGHDLPAVDPHHRHLSPLYFLYPGPGTDDERLLGAAARSLDAREDESTGWSLVWKLALRARLRDVDALERLLALTFRDMSVDRGAWVGGLYPNLLAAHPPFQIDGNLGFVAALLEMVVQSHRGAIALLPAVPPTFGAGRLRGVLARPGVLVDVTWSFDDDGRAVLVAAELECREPDAVGSHRVSFPGGEQLVVFSRLGQRVRLTPPAPPAA